MKLGFPCKKEINNKCINKFGHEEDSIDLLLLNDDHKSHYVYIKDFGRFMFHKTTNKTNKLFCISCLQYFSREIVLIKHGENCFSFNGKQSVKLEKGISEIENYF